MSMERARRILWAISDHLYPSAVVGDVLRDIRAAIETTQTQETSSTAFKVHDYELEQLISWHADEQFRHANREDYGEAEDHKRRGREIRAFLDLKKASQGEGPKQ